MNAGAQTHSFQDPMLPHPNLADFGRVLWLPKANLHIFFYDIGSKDQPAALLLHGLGDEADTWHALAGSISSRWRLIAPDLPGFGRSEGSDRKMTGAFFTSVVLELLEVLEIQRVLLAGHSLGAFLAHQIALEYPNLADGLVLIDGSLVSKPASFSLTTLIFLIPGIGELFYRSLRKDPQAAFRSLDGYYSDLKQLPDDLSKFLYQRVNQRVWSDTQMQAYFSTLRNFAVRAARQPKGLESRLRALGVPTLVFWGSEDDLYSPESGAETARLQPNARLVIIPQAGHNSHQENPGLIARELLKDPRFQPGSAGLF